jgi:hypothetical protein
MGQAGLGLYEQNFIKDPYNTPGTNERNAVLRTEFFIDWEENSKHFRF